MKHQVQDHKSDRYIRLVCFLSFDGLYGVPYFTDGFSHKFRFEAMPRQSFLPNMGANSEQEYSFYGESGRIIIDLIIDATASEHLFVGSKFTLHDAPYVVTARGVVEEIIEDPKTPLRRHVDKL